MYFVRYKVLCARYTGEWDADSLPEETYYFNYDDESAWSLQELELESDATDYDGYHEDLYAHIAAVTELRRRKNGTDDYLCGEWEEVLDRLTEEDDEEEAEEAEAATARRPLIFPDDLSLPVRQMIRKAAEQEREETAFRKRVTAMKPGEITEEILKENDALQEKGRGPRQALTESDLGKQILRGEDPVENMKTLAAQMFFLYSSARILAEADGTEPEEDFYYAGANLYAHAAADQWEEEHNPGGNDDVSRLFDQFTEYGPDGEPEGGNPPETDE